MRLKCDSVTFEAHLHKERTQSHYNLSLSQRLPQFLKITIFTIAHQYVIRTYLGILRQFVYNLVLHQRNAQAILIVLERFNPINFKLNSSSKFSSLTK